MCVSGRWFISLMVQGCFDPHFCPRPQLWLAGRTVPQSRLWRLSSLRTSQQSCGEGGVCCRHSQAQLNLGYTNHLRGSPPASAMQPVGCVTGCWSSECCVLHFCVGAGVYQHMLPLGTTSQMAVSLFLLTYVWKILSNFFWKKCSLCGLL